MRPGKRAWVRLALGILILAFLASGCLDEPPPPEIPKTGYMYIGLVAPRRTPLVDLGQSMIRGAELALETASARKAPNQRPLKLMVVDEMDDDARNGLAIDPRLALVVGHVLESTLAEDRVGYLKGGIPAILPIIGSASALDMGQGHFFSLMPTQEAQARALAEYAPSRLRSRKILILREESLFGQSLSKAFGAALAENKDVRLKEAVVSEKQEDLSKMAADAATDKPDAVFLALHARQAIFAAQALFKAGVKPAYLGTHVLALADAATAFNRLSDRFFLTLPFDAKNPGPAAKTFIEQHQKRFLRPPDWPTILTHDAVGLAVESLLASGDGRKANLNYLTQRTQPGKPYEGLAGTYSFEAGGRCVAPVHVIQADASLLGVVP